MSGEKTSKTAGKSDLEYTYTEDQTAGMVEADTPEPEVAAPKPSFKSKLATGTFKKKLMITLFLLSIVSVVYQFMGGGDTNRVDQKEREAQAQQLKQQAEVQAKKTAAAPPQVVAQKAAVPLPAVEPEPAPTPSASTAPTSAKGALEPPLASTEQTTQLKDLQAGLETTNQSVDDLQTALLNLATSVQKLSAQVEDLAKTHQAQKQAADNNNLSKKMPAVNGKPGKKAPKEMGRLVYNVSAVVPGRAWLYSQQGNMDKYIVTVKVGDLLGGYGLIQSIDPARGVVATSAGGIITYGANDS